MSTQYTQYAGTEQFGEFSKNAVDAAAQLARVSFESAERMFALNLEAAKVGFDQTTKGAKAVTAIKDPQEFSGLRDKAAETGMEFFMGYTKNFYDISANAQAQYAAMVEERVAAFQKSVVEGIDKAAKNAPAGSDVAFNALKSGVAASAAAIDTFSKAAKQVSNLADTAFKSATKTATETAAKATASSKRK